MFYSNFPYFIRQTMLSYSLPLFIFPLPLIEHRNWKNGGSGDDFRSLFENMNACLICIKSDTRTHLYHELRLTG